MRLTNRLFLKLQIVIGLMAALVVVLGGVLLWSEKIQSEVNRAADATLRKQTIIERVDGIVYAVVMESRGLYIAETPQRVEQFGKGLLGHLERLKSATAEWRALIEPAEEADFRAAEAQIAAFIQLRTDLVGAARSGGAAAARAMGDNDANRNTRKALNGALERLTERYRLRSGELEARSEAIKRTMTLITLALVGLIVVLACGTWIWTTRRIAAPVSHLTADLDAISGGALETGVRHTEQGGEIGAIAKSVDAFRARLLEDRQRAAREQEEADASAERAHRLEDAIRAFENAAETRVASLGKTSGELHMAASTLSAGAEETARQAEIVSEASDQMNANIDTLATVGGQLVSAIGEIAQGMGRASDVSERAHALSASMATKFSDLERTVSTIGHVVDLINSIAAQTNLLALNATIEAARAGEAGRGFAIVAQEVKQLAAQTTQATAEITDNVTRVQAVSGDSVAAVASINAAIEDMRIISREVSTAVEEQRAATQEIAANVRSAAAGTQAVTDNIIGVAQAAEETGTSSMKVLQSAGLVQDEAARIRTEVERFLGAIRAA